MIDRNGAYRAVLAELLPGAEVVHDRFHVVANLNGAIDEVRRSEWREAEVEGEELIEGSRYLLMMGRQNLDESGLDRLLEITRLNGKLSTAYILKEEFRLIYIQSVRQRALGTSPNASLVRGGAGILRDLAEITAYFKHRISAGRFEAFNNQIARVIRRTCGMTNLRHLFVKMRAQSLKQI
ncbi:transposase [Haloferula sargassicola]|uniref:Transposase IS204/IS1001/IS1096/IS1165 DDE domain-containing protein n=1 Tax=Haloferula sargassicola TaxID=490096 RepID=A0ABP9UMF1_9BACT